MEKLTRIPISLQTSIKTIIKLSNDTLKNIRMDAQIIREAVKSQKYQRTLHEIRALYFGRPYKKLSDIRRKVVLFGERETTAYCGAFLASQYTITRQVLLELKKRAPEYNPSSILDFGCGPSTCLWAIDGVWADQWKSYNGVDISDDMTNTSKRLIYLEAKSKPYLLQKKISFQKYLAPNMLDAKHDLVTAVSVLCELPNDNARALAVKALWDASSDYVILIENGGPEGYRLIANARQQMLDMALKGGTDCHIVAPCPHESKCPLIDSKSFCEFSTFTELTKDMMTIINSKSNVSRSSFSYVIINKSKIRGQIAEARVLGKTRGKGTVELKLCKSKGCVEKCLLRKLNCNTEQYKSAKEVEVGGLWKE